LVEDVRRLQSSIGKLQDHTAKEIARLEEELHDKRQHIMRLEARLDAQRDYEEVKRQLWWVTKFKEFDWIKYYKTQESRDKNLKVENVNFLFLALFQFTLIV